jgi:hypothetical protein
VSSNNSQVGQDEVAAVDNTAIKDEDAKTSAKMGETDDDMHYDTDLIFKHLWVISSVCLVECTPESSSPVLDASIWIRLRMPAKTACQSRQNMRLRSRTGSSNSSGTIRHELHTKYTSSFETIMGTITKNGGRIGNIDDPKLTHVLLDKRDISRRRELSSRTSQYELLLNTINVLIPSRPKRRYMVLTDFITACLEEETLLDESGETARLCQATACLFLHFFAGFAP